MACGCVICEECRAVLALQIWRIDWLELALNDTDLQRLIAAWSGLPMAIRRAVSALIGSQQP
jgi:hypothetical protein